MYIYNIWYILDFLVDTVLKIVKKVLNVEGLVEEMEHHLSMFSRILLLRPLENKTSFCQSQRDFSWYST